MSRFAGTFAALALSLLLPTAGRATTPWTVITYVGELTDNAGQPIDDDLDLTFRLYAGEDPAAFPDALWDETQSAVPIVGGRFVVYLGSVTPFDAPTLAGPERWLGVSVGETPELLPRLRLTTVPYALHAADAERLGGRDAAEYVLGAALAAVATSGTYGDLTGLPALAPVATSGAYADLTDVPDLGVYALAAELAAVARSGQYGDLEGRPTLAAVATTGDYADLAGQPDLSGYALTADLQPVCFSGSYLELLDTPDLSVFALRAELAAVATSGDYDDLANRPDLTVYVRTADFQTALAGKADVSHSHTITSADIADGTIRAEDTDPSSVQTRVSGTCAAGSAIRAVGTGGTVTCEDTSQRAYALATTTCRRVQTCTNAMTECNATCNEDERVTGGGVGCYSTGGWKTFIADSSPHDDMRGWHGRCIDPDGVMHGLAYVYAICCAVR